MFRSKLWKVPEGPVSELHYGGKPGQRTRIRVCASRIEGRVLDLPRRFFHLSLVDHRCVRAGSIVAFAYGGLSDSLFLRPSVRHNGVYHRFFGEPSGNCALALQRSRRSFPLFLLVSFQLDASGFLVSLRDYS